MTAYAPRLPLTVDEIDGAYGLVKDLNLLAKQNLKMLLLTEPGERMMIPNYGIGLKRYLFENKSKILESSILTRINIQIKNYLPYINLIDAKIEASEDGSSMSEQAYQITLLYYIIPLKVEDALTIVV